MQSKGVMEFESVGGGDPPLFNLLDWNFILLGSQLCERWVGFMVGYMYALMVLSFSSLIKLHDQSYSS